MITSLTTTICKLFCIFILLFCGINLYAGTIEVLDYSFSEKDAKKNDSGYGVAVYIKGIRVTNAEGHTIGVSAWLRDKNGDYEGYTDCAEFISTESNYLHKEEIRVFYYDTYMMDLYGYGNTVNLTLCIGIYDYPPDGSQPEGPSDWIEVPFRITLVDRGKPLTITEEAETLFSDNNWQKTAAEPLEFSKIDSAILPSGDTFFTADHSIMLTGRGFTPEVASLHYMPPGNMLLVSDDHSRLFLFDINSGKALWQINVEADSYFAVYIDDIRDDGKECLITHRLQRVGGNTEISIHSTRDGKKLGSLHETSSYYYKPSPYSQPDDLLGEPMIAVSATYSDDGKSFYVVWRNMKVTHGMFDFKLTCHDAFTYSKKWEWQIIDPRGLDRVSNGRHLALRLLLGEHSEDDIYLFSETGEVRKLAYSMIKKNETIVNLADKEYGTLLYTLDVKKGRYPQYFTKTSSYNVYYTAFVDDDGIGNLGKMDIKTGKIIWQSQHEAKYTALSGINEGEYLVSRGGSYWNLWNTDSGRIIASGPYFYQNRFGDMDINPQLKEFAIAFDNEIYFFTEHQKKSVEATFNLQKSGIYITPQSEIVGYGKGDIALILSPEITYGDGEENYKTEASYVVHAGGPYLWEKMYFNRHKGRELYIRALSESAIWNIWGGLTSREYSDNTGERRKNLSRW